MNHEALNVGKKPLIPVTIIFTCFLDGSSSNSSGVLINKSEADDLDDDDFDIDLDDVDGDEEELAKMVQEIKNKSAAGDLQVLFDYFIFIFGEIFFNFAIR